MEELARYGIPLEVCITSNVQTKAAPSLKDHPIRRLYDAGVHVTLNTDNRTVSATTLPREIALAKSGLWIYGPGRGTDGGIRPRRSFFVSVTQSLRLVAQTFLFREIAFPAT